MPTTELSPLANHLWQSTLCALVAWMLALLLRKNRAAVRYGIWLAASIKFLVPFSLLVSAGSHVRLPLVPTNPAQSFSSAVEEIERPFGLPDPTRRPTTRPVSYPGPGILFVIWLAGFAAVVWTWCRWWRRIRAIQREATPWPLNVAVPVMFAAGRLEPGIFGIWKPVLLLPEGINEHLRSDQFETVLAHELCHVRRRDNLTAAMHMVSEAVFWFYPLLWWIRARLILERERACDEEVLRTGVDPQIYAESILNVCRFYLSAHTICLPGVTGSDLRKRIEEIVSNRASDGLSGSRKFLLALIAAAVVATPLVIGMATAPVSTAYPQTDTHPPSFEAASIRPAAIAPGREGGNRSRVEHTPTSLTMWNVGVEECVQWAYGIAHFQISAAHLSTDSYDIRAKTGSPVPVGQLRMMLQDLLANRFKLTLHRETRMVPVYELVVAKGGPKLPAANNSVSHPAVHSAESLPRIRDDSFVFADASMAEFAAMLTQLHGIDLPVVDHTRIAGTYDLALKSAPNAAREGDTAALFAIVQEQLGLKLAATKAPIEVVVIDHAERPSEN